jgi:hypothetical protein
MANSTAETFDQRLASSSAVVVAADAEQVHHEDHRREGHTEAGQHDVRSEGERHLVAGRQQPDRGVISHRRQDVGKECGKYVEGHALRLRTDGHGGTMRKGTSRSLVSIA